MNRSKKIAILGLHLILLLLITTSVYSQELSNGQFSENFGKPVIDYEQIIYAVLFLIILIVAGLFLVKKSNYSTSKSSGLIDIVYNYDASTMPTDRTTTRRWYREDGSVHPDAKVTHKVYTLLHEKMAVNARKRKNILDEIKITTLGMMIQTM